MDIQIVLVLIAGLLGVAVGAGVLTLVRNLGDDKKRRAVDVEVDRIVNRAKSEASKIEKEAQRKATDFEKRARKNVEAEILKEKQKIQLTEKELEKKKQKADRLEKEKLEDIEKKTQRIAEKEAAIEATQQRIEEVEKRASELKNELADKLTAVSKLTEAEAKEELLKALEDKIKLEAHKRALIIEKEMESEARTRAKRILAQAVSRYASEYVTERTVSVVALPNDELKGKIIGREGRNIRTLENLCGVDLIIDDTPEAVVISGFDPVRREVAKRTLEKLMEDGRVHPARIEEVVERVKTDFFKSFRDDGEKAVFDLGLHNVHAELLKLLGSLKYRTTGAWNNYHQSVEVGFVAGLIVAELGGNVKTARRAGLLHAVGKAVDHTVEGSYAAVGAETAKRFGENEVVVRAIRVHNGEEEARSVIDFALQAAFALVSQRPGGRRPSFQSYINRLEDLESIANSFDGVQKSFALQAGREVRVIVESRRVTDEQSSMLARDIARKIERELSYPGQIVVSVARETRAIEHAR